MRCGESVEELAEGRVNNAGYAGRPSVCRSCGALVGAGESKCGMCGAPLASGASAQAQSVRRPSRDPESLRFIRAIITRPATFTFIILTVNIFVFILMTLAGGSENHEVLRAYGAKYNSLINQGEWWRLVTPVFMHIGIIHLLVNMYSLFVIGPYVEKLYGSAKFVVFWVLTGIAGVGASYFASMYGMQEGFLGRFLFRGGDGPSAGASGALFGLVGVLFVFGIKFRRELPEEFKRAFGTGMLPTILINLFIGYTIPFIDNAAHLGGFLAGVVLALFVHYKRPGDRAGMAIAWHVVQVAALLLVVAGFVFVGLHFKGPPPALTNAHIGMLAGGGPDVDAFVEAVNGGREAFFQTLDEDAGASEPALEKLNHVPALNQKGDALRDELKSLLMRAHAFAIAPPAPRERPQQLRVLTGEFKDWDKRFNQWVATEGAEFDLRLQKDAPKEKSQPPADATPSPDKND